MGGLIVPVRYHRYQLISLVEGPGRDFLYLTDAACRVLPRNCAASTADAVSGGSCFLSRMGRGPSEHGHVMQPDETQQRPPPALPEGPAAGCDSEGTSLTLQH